MKAIEALKQSKNPIYIYGKNSCSNEVFKCLDENGISVAGYFLDEEFLTEEYRSEGVLSVEDIMEKREEEPIDIVCGFFNFGELYHKISKGIVRGKGDSYVIYFKHLIEKNYFKENLSLFQETYDMLEDELSKKTFLAYLQCRMNDNGRELM